MVAVLPWKEIRRIKGAEIPGHNRKDEGDISDHKQSEGPGEEEEAATDSLRQRDSLSLLSCSIASIERREKASTRKGQCQKSGLQNTSP